MRSTFCVSLALCTLLAASAAAQRRTTLGFETNCSGAGISPDALLIGYSTYGSNQFAPCGVSSIVTGETPGQMEIARNGVLNGIPNVVGQNALAGAFGNFNPSNITINFSPAVNEVSFQVLGIDANDRLRVATYDSQDAQLSEGAAANPSGGRVFWSRNSSTPIARILISYPQSAGGILSIVDRWYIDELSFNAWVCGDGEVDDTNGGSEVCDDGNSAQCDGCSNTCTASIMGCFDGTSCLANGTVSGCISCDTSKPPAASGDVLTSVTSMGTSCDDQLKCTLGDACDGAGRCVGSARSCDDAVTCTSDTCSEAAAADGCVHTLGAHDCLIGAACVPELAANPANPCQLCNPALSPSAWSPQPATLRCGNASCVGDQFTPAALCDGAGACSAVTPMSCGNFACATSTSCTDSCTDDRECGSSSHCDAATMKCVTNLAAGQPCSASAQCATGLACSDGVCCDSACGSKCETCSAPGFLGKCVNITVGDPDNECPTGSSCRSGNQCVANPAPGQPTLPTQPTPPAQPIAVLPLGAACDRNEVCGLAVCKDGVCCDSACDGPCQGCKVLGATPGVCTAYSLGSDPENECAGVGGVCGGDNRCASFQTRGNGLCSASPGQRGDSRYALGALFGLALLLAYRRKQRART
jgi:Dickkopf N-terminal cysteine-rich region